MFAQFVVLIQKMRWRIRRRNLLTWGISLITLVSCTLLVSQPEPTPTPISEPIVITSSSFLFSPEERRKTVVFEIDGGLTAEPYWWNPLVGLPPLEAGFHQVMIEPLFILNYESGAIEPWLGESMTANETQDVWTLKLRPGVTWSDGMPFTADDVVFTFNMLMQTDTSQLVRQSFNAIEDVAEVTKRDRLTVEFRLNKPNPRFQLNRISIKMWSGLPIVPKHIWQDKDILSFTNYDLEQGWPVFTGPYTLVSASDSQFIYRRNDDWWGAKTGFQDLPKPERLVWIAPISKEERDSLAIANDLDSMMDMPLEDFQFLQEHNPNIIAWLEDLPYAWVDPCSRLLSLNHRVEPWDDKIMRWAVNFAIDRNEIVAEAYQGTTIPSKHFFPAYSSLNRYVQLLEKKGLYEEYPLTTHDPERARRLIEAKGWERGADGFYEKNGIRLTLEIQVHEAFVEKIRIATVLMQQLRRVGIDATIKPVDDRDWANNKRRGYYEGVVDWDTCDSVTEPWSSLNRYHAKWVQPIGEFSIAKNNHIRWRNVEYSTIIDEMEQLPVGDERVDDLFVSAMEIWFEELPFIPLTQARKLIPFNTTYWEGWPTAQNNYIHPPTWWQSSHIIIHNLRPATSSFPSSQSP